MNVQKQKRRAAALARFTIRPQIEGWNGMSEPRLIPRESDKDYAAYLARKAVEKKSLEGGGWKMTPNGIAIQQDAEADEESAACYAEEAAYYAELDQGYAQDRI